MQGLGLVHVCPTLIRMLVAAQGGDVAALGPGVRVHIKPLPQKEDGVGGKNKNKVKGHERSNNADVSGIKRAHDVYTRYNVNRILARCGCGTPTVPATPTRQDWHWQDPRILVWRNYIFFR